MASQVVAWLRGVGRGGDVRRVRLAGHSLGGALATLAAVHLAEEFNVEAGRPQKRLGARPWRPGIATFLGGLEKRGAASWVVG